MSPSAFGIGCNTRAGPGAFTGLRVGASVAAGLAAANQTPIGKLSSLALLAASAEQSGEVVALLDARMGQCYAGFYHFAEQVVALGADRLATVDSLPLTWRQAETAVGPGLIYAGMSARRCLPQCLPQARFAFRLLDLVRWQSADQMLDLDYLRDEVTQHG